MQDQPNTEIAEVELSADGRTPLWDRDPDGPYRYVSVQDRDRRTAYGIRQDQVDAILQEQDGCCYLCGRRFGPRQRRCVDHSHDTGEIFGIAHGPCNLKRKMIPTDPPARRAGGPFFVPTSRLERLARKRERRTVNRVEKRQQETDRDAKRGDKREELRRWYAEIRGDRIEELREWRASIREGEPERRHTDIVAASVRELCAWVEEEAQVAGFVEADSIEVQAGAILRSPQYRGVRIAELRREWVRTPQGRAWQAEARMRRMPSNGSRGAPTAIDPSGRTGTPGGLRQMAARWAHRVTRRPHED